MRSVRILALALSTVIMLTLLTSAAAAHTFTPPYPPRCTNDHPNGRPCGSITSVPPGQPSATTISSHGIPVGAALGAVVVIMGLTPLIVRRRRRTHARRF